MDLLEIDSSLTWLLALSGSLVVGLIGIIILYNNFGYSSVVGIITLFFIT